MSRPVVSFAISKTTAAKMAIISELTGVPPSFLVSHAVKIHVDRKFEEIKEEFGIKEKDLLPIIEKLDDVRYLSLRKSKELASDVIERFKEKLE